MDTIAAIATPPGQGGIGIVRISGPRAGEILRRMFVPANASFRDFVPRMLHLGHIVDQAGEPLDQCLAVFMPGPATFTGEDTAELQCHGNFALCRLILAEALRQGARQAERGEFSRRAFLNGRIDLSQAEAIAELAAAPSRSAMRYSLRRLDGELGRRVAALRASLDNLRLSACVALDFTAEETGEILVEDFCAQLDEILEQLGALVEAGKRAELSQRGRLVVLAGPPNAGKSSLLNYLCGSERALVTPHPGTTRDFIDVALDMAGLPVRLVDTAGLRLDATDPIERLGVARSEELLAQADLVLLVIDGVSAEVADGRLLGPYADILANIEVDALCLWNKCDVRPAPPDLLLGQRALELIPVSALTGANMDRLVALLENSLTAELPAEEDLAPNVRQAESLRAASAELEFLRADLLAGVSVDCCLGRLDTARLALDELLGLAPHDELLNRIFDQFCIGK